MADRIIAEMTNREWGFTAVVIHEPLMGGTPHWGVSIIKADGTMQESANERHFHDKEAAMRHAATVAFGFQFEAKAAPAAQEGAFAVGTRVLLPNDPGFGTRQGALARVVKVLPLEAGSPQIAFYEVQIEGTTALADRYTVAHKRLRVAPEAVRPAAPEDRPLRVGDEVEVVWKHLLWAGKRGKVLIADEDDHVAGIDLGDGKPTPIDVVNLIRITP